MAQNVSTSPTTSSLSSWHVGEVESSGEHSRPSIGSRKIQTRGAPSLDLNESSPLLSPVRDDDGRISEDHDALTGLLDWSDGQEEGSKSVFYLFILTLSIGG